MMNLRKLIVPALVLGVVAVAWPKKAAAKPSKKVDKKFEQGLVTQGYSAAEISRILAVQPLVEKYAAENKIKPDLVNGVIWVESRFQPGVTSSAGARGLMQLMPSTQAGLEKKLGLEPGDGFNPTHNIRLGTNMLKALIKKWKGDMRLVLGSYNWGSGNVAESPDVFPKQVENYVKVVLNAKKRFEKARG